MDGLTRVGDVGTPRAMALCIRSELGLLEMNEKGG